MQVYRPATVGALVCLVVVVTACFKSARVTSPVFTSPAVSSPLPTSSTPILDLEVPRPEAGKGNVHGFLLLPNFPLPLETTELYLGDIFTSDDGKFSTFYFDRSKNPRGRWINAETGEFLFENVTPGEYVLILWWDIQNYIPVHRAGSAHAITITVIPDSLTELGVIVSNQ
ncbi:MAG: hypothetical protein ACPLYD_15835 [Anaerolineae bacterium]